jgi:hypothetical protein
MSAELATGHGVEFDVAPNGKEAIFTPTAPVVVVFCSGSRFVIECSRILLALGEEEFIEWFDG